MISSTNFLSIKDILVIFASGSMMVDKAKLSKSVEIIDEVYTPAVPRVLSLKYLRKELLGPRFFGVVKEF